MESTYCLESCFERQHNHVSVVSFNVLADRYTTEAGKLDSRWLPMKKYMSWDHRFKCMKRQFQTMKADLFCLQEVQYSSFDEDFLPFFQSIGYEGDIQIRKKGDVTIVGTATFYRRDKFTLKSKVHRTRGMITSYTMTCSSNEQMKEQLFVVANIHLQAKVGKSYDRCCQMRKTLQSVETICDQDGEGKMNTHVVMCGDYNCGPTSAPIQIALRNNKEFSKTLAKKMNKKQQRKMHKKEMKKMVQKKQTQKEQQKEQAQEQQQEQQQEQATLKHKTRDSSLCSSFSSSTTSGEESNDEFAFSSEIQRIVEKSNHRVLFSSAYKGIRHPTYITYGFEAQLDHILHSPSLVPEVVMHPCGERAELAYNVKTPNAFHPSDHLPVGTVFRVVVDKHVDSLLPLPPPVVNEDPSSAAVDQWLALQHQKPQTQTKKGKPTDEELAILRSFRLKEKDFLEGFTPYQVRFLKQHLKEEIKRMKHVKKQEQQQQKKNLKRQQQQRQQDAEDALMFSRCSSEEVPLRDSVLNLNNNNFNTDMIA
eukprot:m.78712 g.78712  ORF g.78712 m.78712 type:complete len:534 (-) comp11964_c0_seq3:27-1628(-)